jgi:hypothetical protein
MHAAAPVSFGRTVPIDVMLHRITVADAAAGRHAGSRAGRGHNGFRAAAALPSIHQGEVTKMVMAGNCGSGAEQGQKGLCPVMQEPTAMRLLPMFEGRISPVCALMHDDCLVVASISPNICWRHTSLKAVSSVL